MEADSKRFIALTFDDGPSPYTLEILQILKTLQVKATFFILGESLDKYPGILQAIVKDGHTVANHTMNHPDITKISRNVLLEEIEILNLELKKTANQDVKFFRPPYGAINEEIYRTIHELGLIPVLWDIDTNDWDLSQEDQIEERVMEGIRAGKENKIVLMHDGGGPRERTVQALPRIIENLREKGYEFLTMQEYFYKIYNRKT
ncbi:polysaccharide deacetylase family protein [Niallia sp. MER 6]|uniref:polysaccharide deacetylase family protein n=1 Tax=Niallia sp. MER 6 TaxID=2939567 RepID=UPI00203EC3A3|nr:polysaccharide deacetylase family protein [Niallia sp. MER 6]MCM3033037.1 polysaccharide deacetylase family protein [Niallia sp. MER 6]